MPCRTSPSPARRSQPHPVTAINAAEPVQQHQQGQRVKRTMLPLDDHGQRGSCVFAWMSNIKRKTSVRNQRLNYAEILIANLYRESAIQFPKSSVTTKETQLQQQGPPSKPRNRKGPYTGKRLYLLLRSYINRCAPSSEIIRSVWHISGGRGGEVQRRSLTN